MSVKDIATRYGLCSSRNTIQLNEHVHLTIEDTYDDAMAERVVVALNESVVLTSAFVVLHDMISSYDRWESLPPVVKTYVSREEAAQIMDAATRMFVSPPKIENNAPESWSIKSPTWIARRVVRLARRGSVVCCSYWEDRRVATYPPDVWNTLVANGGYPDVEILHWTKIVSTFKNTRARVCRLSYTRGDACNGIARDEVIGERNSELCTPCLSFVQNSDVRDLQA